MYGAPNDVQIPRFGVSVGKACGGAIARNRLKRLGREVFRTHQHQVRSGTDYILIFSVQKKKVQENKQASRQAFKICYKELETIMLDMIRAVESKLY